MDRHSGQDPWHPMGFETLPAGALYPVSNEAVKMAPSDQSPLAVDVHIEFTDPIIHSQYSTSYATSPTFVPTESVCEELSRRLRHACEDLITRKDPHALERYHELTLEPKRQRYGITFTILRRGCVWMERTFKSYQRQPLTVDFTRQVVSAMDRTVRDCLGSYDGGFRCLDGTVQPGIMGILTPPLSPTPMAADDEGLEKGVDNFISLAEDDAELRQLELVSPTWSIREPLDMSLCPAASRPTIESVLERGTTEPVHTATEECASDDLSQLRDGQAAAVITGKDMTTHRNVEEKTLSRYFQLLNRSSHSLSAKDDFMPRASFKHSRATSLAFSVKSERGTTSSPRVFPLVPRKYSLASRSSTISAAAVEPLGTHTPAEEAAETTQVKEEDVSVLASEPLGTTPPEPTKPEAASTASTAKSSLGSPILLARDAMATEQGLDSPVAEADVSISDSQGKAASANEKLLNQEFPASDDSTDTSVDVTHMVGQNLADDDVIDSTDVHNLDRPRVSTDLAEHRDGSSPSTPALSAGSDSSPRYSVIMTPTVLRTQALVNDSILHAEFSKGEPSSPTEESLFLQDDNTSILVQDLDRAYHGKTPSVAEESRDDNTVEEPQDICDTENNGCVLNIREADTKLEDNPDSSSTNEPLVEAAADEETSNDHNHSILEEASMVQLPSSPPMPPLDDADSELLEASMIELPSSPTLGLMDETRICPEAETAGNADEGTFLLDSSMVEDDRQSVTGQEEIGVSQDTASVSETVRLGANGMEEHRTSWYNEESSVIVDDGEEPSELPSSPLLPSAEATRLVTEGVDVKDLEDTESDDGVGAVREEEFVPDPEFKGSGVTEAQDFDADVQRHAEESGLPALIDGPRDEAAGLGLEASAINERTDIPQVQEEGALSHPQSPFTTGPPSEEAEIMNVHSSQMPSPEQERPPMLKLDMDVSGEPAAEFLRTTDHHMELSGDDNELEVQHAEDTTSEIAAADTVSSELLASEVNRQREDISGQQDLNTGADDAEDGLLDVNPSVEAPAELARSEPMPPPLTEMPPVVDEKAEVEHVDDANSHSADNADYEVDLITRQTVPENAEEVSAVVSPEEGLALDTQPVERQLSHETQASANSVEAEQTMSHEDIAGLDSECDLDLFEAQNVEAPVESSNGTNTPESTFPELDIISTTSELDEEECRELDSDEDAITTESVEEDLPREEHGAAVSLDTAAGEARVRAPSSASDLPSLFAPAISNWLADSDHISDEITELSQEPHPFDTEQTAPVAESVGEVEEPADITQSQETEGARQLIASPAPYVAAQELSDPFDLVRPGDSVSVGDETESLHDSHDEEHDLFPYTPRRQLTFPIPTPFSLRTTSYSPAHAPSQALSTYSSSPRSSLSAGKPSIDLNRNSVDTVSLRRNSVDTIDPSRNSVDTIAPLPSDNSPPSSPQATATTPRPSTAGWLGVRGSSTTTRRFSMPLSHVWDPSGSSDRGSHTSRPGTPTSTATVRYASNKRSRGSGGKRPRLSDLAPRPGTSGGVLESVRAEEDGERRGGVAGRFVMLFAGVEFAKKALGGEHSP